MKNILLILAILTATYGTTAAQKTDGTFNCNEITFWQSSMADKIKNNNRPIDDEEVYASDRIPSGFDKCVLKKSNYSTATEGYYDDNKAAKGKDSVTERGNGFEAEKAFASEKDAQDFYNTILKSLNQCLKSEKFTTEEGTNGVGLLKVIDNSDQLIVSSISLAVVPLMDRNVMGEFPVGYKVVLDWSYRVSRFY